MHILALETTGKYGSAAVIDQDGNCCAAASSDVMNHLKDIITLTEECLRNAGIEKTDLTHIGASVGPGSFTGIRIGVTTARTLGQVLELPCVSVSTLEAMAYQGMENGSGEEYICPIINARRHQTYAGLWKVTADGLESVLSEKQYMIEDLLTEIRKLEGTVFFTGDGIDAYSDIISSALSEEQYAFAPESVRYQDGRSVAQAALRRVQSGETVSYEKLLPNYMRKSEAEMRLESGTLSSKIHG